MTLTEVTPDPVTSAKEAGLRYTTEDQLTITRKKAGSGWQYWENGKKVTDEKIIERINGLVLPPAWTDVRIAKSERSHLQAVGVDERGRKQYRYHPEWQKFRQDVKYERMMAFGRALPKIRRQVLEDLTIGGMPKEKVMAVIVRLLEKTMIRVGNEQYAKENKSYGLTTLRNRHVSVESGTITLSFKGKSNKFHTIELHDGRLSRLIRRLQELPGQELFQYIDENDELRSIDSADVNEYLQEITGADFTAKDFRTWKGTILAALALAECERSETERENKRLVSQAVKLVADELGNTPTVCRKCYIHPMIIASFLDGNLVSFEETSDFDADIADLFPEEKAVLRFLKRVQAA